MKFFIALVFGLSLFVIGCATAPPTRLEQGLFNVTTNTTFATNVWPVVTFATNDTGELLPVTNWESAVIAVHTYDYKPGEKAQAIVETGATIGNMLGGVGGLVGTGLAGLFAIWAQLRSRKNGQTAAVLAQVIETGRAILATTPQGTQLDQQWRAWMMKHQAETGVFTEVMKLVGTVVDNGSAKQVAQQLVALMNGSTTVPEAK